MKIQNPQTEKKDNVFILAIGAIFHLLVILYGGEKETQKKPIGFILYCIGMITALILIMIGIIYITT